MILRLVMRIAAVLVLMLGGYRCATVAPHEKSSIRGEAVISGACTSMERGRKPLIQMVVSRFGRVGVRPTVTNCVLQVRVHSGIVHAQLMTEGQPALWGKPPALQPLNSMSYGREEKNAYLLSILTVLPYNTVLPQLLVT